MSTKAEQAITFHDKGYNCAQAVACSFCKEFGVDRGRDVPYCRRIRTRHGNDGGVRRTFRNDDDHWSAEQRGPGKRKK